MQKLKWIQRVLAEGNETKKDKYHMVSYTWNLKIRKQKKPNEQFKTPKQALNTENSLIAAKGQRHGQNRHRALKDRNFQL